MKFTILSHAAMLVEADGVRLLIDPWLVGSCYWRSWWNYPKPKIPAGLLKGLEYVYLSHMHWDHFHGPSLRKLNPQATVLIPYAHFARMERDVKHCGLSRIVEMPRGRSVSITPRLKLTSYHYGLSLDSALVIEDGETTLVNLNDCKINGWPLRQLTRRHPRIDFVFRSHSSASAYPYCIEAEDPSELRFRSNDDYLRDFVETARLLKARYAVPFASNHCFLHRETWQYNNTAVSPLEVHDYFEQHAPGGSRCTVMVPGDAWDAADGYSLQAQDFFTDRERHLAAYREEKAATLEKQYRREDAARVTFADFQGYFAPFMASLPRIGKLVFRAKVVFRVSGEPTPYWVVDFGQRAVYEAAQLPSDYALLITVPALVLRDCLRKRMFAVFTASKRLSIRVPRGKVRNYFIFFQLLDMYEYDYFLARKLLSPRFVRAWLPRWREVAHYGWSLAKMARSRKSSALGALLPKVS